MLQQITAPDIDDERHPWMQGGDVREVLIGPDAEIDAVRQRALLQFGDNLLIRALVRDKVVGAEEPVGLGRLGDQAPELAVAELSRQRIRNDLRADSQEGRATEARAQKRDDKRLAAAGSQRAHVKRPIILA